MGRRNFNGAVSICNDKDIIRLRWRADGKRYSLNLPWLYERSNLVLAKKVAHLIEEEVSNDIFDISLIRYKDLVADIFNTKQLSDSNERRKLLLFKPKDSSSLNDDTTNAQTSAELESNPSVDFVQLFKTWTELYRNMSCEEDIDYLLLHSMLLKWKIKNPEDSVIKLQKEIISVSTFNRRLTMLKKFFSWLVKKKHIQENPFEDVLRKRSRKKEIPTRKLFTLAETQQILSAIKEDRFVHPSSRYKHSHYYPFIYFLFSTGVRNAEAVGLRAENVDIGKNKIKIERALARTLKGTHAKARIDKETKNGKIRELPLSEDLKEVLLPVLQNKKPTDLVFTSITGKCIDDRMFLRRVFKPVLNALNIEYRTLYACRHGFASRLIAAGVNPVTTAFLLGNNRRQRCVTTRILLICRIHCHKLFRYFLRDELTYLTDVFRFFFCFPIFLFTLHSTIII